MCSSTIGARSLCFTTWMRYNYWVCWTFSYTRLSTNLLLRVLCEHGASICSTAPMQLPIASGSPQKIDFTIEELEPWLTGKRAWHCDSIQWWVVARSSLYIRWVSHYLVIYNTQHHWALPWHFFRWPRHCFSLPYKSAAQNHLYTHVTAILELQ